MATVDDSQQESEAGDGCPQEQEQQLRDYVSGLPTVPAGPHGHLYLHPDGWYATMPIMMGALAAQRHFVARGTDVVLASFPKTGTVWLKALLVATLHRGGDALATANPHELVPFLEAQVYAAGRVPAAEADDDLHVAPRVVATHVPYPTLPPTVASGCKVVYLFRGAKDTVVSLWHFLNKIAVASGGAPRPMETAVERFCAGTTVYGPYWEHVLGYWRAHKENPDRVMFLRYEEAMAAPVEAVRRLAEFLGRPFGADEEEEEEAERVVRACGIETLRGLQVNTGGSTETVFGSIDNKVFFRKGVVGDWSNWMTPELARRVDDVFQQRLTGSGISLQ